MRKKVALESFQRQEGGGAGGAGGAGEAGGAGVQAASNFFLSRARSLFLSFSTNECERVIRREKDF